MQLFLDLVIVVENGIGRQAIAAIGPKDYRRVGAEFEKTIPQTGARGPLVLSAPQIPVLPLHAAHPAQHYGNTFAVRALNHGVVGNLQLPANQIQSEIFSIVKSSFK